jgi:hypothetical protein
VKFEIKSGSSYLANDRARYRYNALGMRALVERGANTTDTSHSINERRYLYFKKNPGREAGVLCFQPEAEMELRVVANSSPHQTHERRVLLIQITRARLSLSLQRFRGVGQGGWCGGVSGS